MASSNTNYNDLAYGDTLWKSADALLGQSVPQIQRPLTTLRQASLQFPILPEQGKVAGVLGALDDKIGQKRRTAQALGRLAQAIFRAWFVDFEPVKAKTAGVASFSSMPREVFDALPSRFVDSEIGPIPEGSVAVTSRSGPCGRASRSPKVRPR